MDCYKIRDLFGEYIEHQLNEEELKNFEKHMEECSECRNEFYKFEKMIFRLKSIKDIEPPKELKDKIMKKVVSEENKKLNAKIINFRKYSSVAAALVVIVFSVIYYQSSLIKTQNLNSGKDTNTISFERTNGENYLQAQGRAIPESEEKISTFNSNNTLAKNSKNVEQRNLQDNIPINFYEEGININILTNDIEKFKSFLINNVKDEDDKEDFKNIQLYEDNPNYIEIVLNKTQFEELEKKFSNNEEYTISISNLDEVLENINKVIDEGFITEEGLIKFKINIEEEI